MSNDLIQLNKPKKRKVKKVLENGDKVMKLDDDDRFNKLEEIIDVNGTLTKRLLSISKTKSGNGKLTSEAILLLKYGIAIGGTVKDACLLAGISEWNYYDWKKSYPKMFDNIENLRNIPALKSLATVFRNLDNTDTAKWYLERKRKDEYSLRTESLNTNINANYDTLLAQIEKGDEEIITEDINGEVLDRMDLIYDVVEESGKRRKKFQAENLKKNVNDPGKNRYERKKAKVSTPEIEE